MMRSNPWPLLSAPSGRAFFLNRSDWLLPLSSAFAFAFRLLFPYGLSDMRRLISEPLSDDALQRAISAGNVIDAERNAIRVAKVKLGKVTVQMLFLAVLVYAFHAAFEN